MEIEGREEDLFIPEDKVNGAYHLDTVEVVLLRKPAGKRQEAEVIKIGATTDQAMCRKAQDLAQEKIVPLYEALDNATLHLMEINIEKEHEMEQFCTILEYCAMGLMVLLLVLCLLYFLV